MLYFNTNVGATLSCRPKAATAMNSRVGRLGGHSHDSRNLTFLFRSREATTHRVYLNEVDTPLARFWALPCSGPFFALNPVTYRGPGSSVVSSDSSWFNTR